MKRRGWTLLEVMVAGSLLLLLVGGATLALITYSRTLRGLQQEGDQMARAAFALERLQRQILVSQPLPPGDYDLELEPMVLKSREGQATEVSLANAVVSWHSRVQGPARRVRARVWRDIRGRQFVTIDWEISGTLASLKSTFDATVLP